MASLLKDHMPKSYRSVARMIGFCLFLDDDWNGLITVLAAKLSQRQRGLVAWAALRSLPPDIAEEVALAALPAGAGLPFDANNDPLADAVFWARDASQKEIDAYALASIRAMSNDRKRLFLDFLQQEEAA